MKPEELLTPMGESVRFSPGFNENHKHNEIVPRRGVVTVFGYGISAHVDRGHLVLEDGIGPNRRHSRFARVGHGLKRVVAIGSDGQISFAAIRWLTDQKRCIRYVGKRREGARDDRSRLTASDIRLRRAQALAHQSDLALRMARELIAQKLRNQEHLVKKYFFPIHWQSKRSPTLVACCKPPNRAMKSDSSRHKVRWLTGVHGTICPFDFRE